MHRGQHALWISLLGLSACSPKITTYAPVASVASVASVQAPAPEPPLRPRPALKVSGPQLAALRMMALGDAADPQAAGDWGRKIESGAATVSDYVDHLLSQPQFASSIALRSSCARCLSKVRSWMPPDPSCRPPGRRAIFISFGSCVGRTKRFL